MTLFNYKIPSIRSFKAFIVFIIVLSMANNIEHGAKLYLFLSDQEKNWIAYSVVIVVDLTVIAFVLKGKEKESRWFAWGLFVVNLLYWDILTVSYQLVVSLLMNNPDLFFDLLKKLIAMLLWSGVFAYSIHRFSLLLKEEIDNEAENLSAIEVLQDELKEAQLRISDKERDTEYIRGLLRDSNLKNRELSEELNTTKKALTDSTDQLHALKLEKEDLAQWKASKEAALKCKYCDHISENSHERAAHMKSCEKNPAQQKRKD